MCLALCKVLGWKSRTKHTSPLERDIGKQAGSISSLHDRLEYVQSTRNRRAPEKTQAEKPGKTY